MSDEKIWFPFYVGDYLGDTMHLDRADHGSYILMLCRYYKTGGPLPDDDRALAKTAGVSLSDWPATRSVLAQFFKISNGLWTHKRAEFEIKRIRTLQLARSKGAASTNAKRWKSLSDSQCDTLSDDLASRSSVGNQSHIQSHIQSQNTAQKNIARFVIPTLEQIKLAASKIGLAEIEAQKFFNFYESKGWMVGKNKMKSINGAMSNWKIRMQENLNNGNHKPNNFNDVGSCPTTTDYAAAIERKNREREESKT